MLSYTLGLFNQDIVCTCVVILVYSNRGRLQEAHFKLLVQPEQDDVCLCVGYLNTYTEYILNAVFY